MPEFLQEDALRLLLFGGKGGVGKTTCAAAAALFLAHTHPEKNYLLVSTDPAHSLLDCFAGQPPPDNLTLCEIDPQQSLARFKARHESHLRTIALRGTFLDQADVNQFLDLSIPGLDEMMALLEIEAWVKADRYACIVVDTAPAGHTLRLLGLPAIMRRWVDALDAMLAKYRYMAQLYRGAYQPEAVDLYLQETLTDLKHLWALLRSRKRCRFVPVMLAEALSIHVTRVMLDELARLGLPVREVVVNRLLAAPADCPVCVDEAARQTRALHECTQVFTDHVFWGLPLLLTEVRGTAPLLRVWPQARRLVPAHLPPLEPAPLNAPQTNTRVRIAYPAPLPAPTLKLLLFAGKGGVGKTTLACASALRLTEARPGQQVLLFSIDPAHSLAACLGCDVGPQETQVIPRLHVIELDSQAEYALLKQTYAAELTRMFDRPKASSGIDVAFDRDVMTRLLDIAPPGLDEMLALTRIVDLMERKCYDLFVLDTAPTGHLIRFLEMPELIEQWLTTFFALFLKYRDVFWLPKITHTMVELSKKLKVFRRLLKDPQQTALMAVTIPTEMAFAETGDLISACQRLGVAVPTLWVNLATPASACPTCTVLHRAQQPLLQRYQTANAGRHMTLVFRQPEPRGFERLRALGHGLYESSNLPTVLPVAQPT